MFRNSKFIQNHYITFYWNSQVSINIRFLVKPSNKFSWLQITTTVKASSGTPTKLTQVILSPDNTQHQCHAASHSWLQHPCPGITSSDFCLIVRDGSCIASSSDHPEHEVVHTCLGSVLKWCYWRCWWWVESIDNTCIKTWSSRYCLFSYCILLIVAPPLACIQCSIEARQCTKVLVGGLFKMFNWWMLFIRWC